MSNGYAVDTVNHFGPDVSGFFMQAAEDFDIVVVRDQDYLNWRYADMRAGAFSILLANHSAKIAGYLVLKTEGETKVCYIVDMLVSPERFDVANLLLVNALQHARRSNAIALHGWTLRDHAYSNAFKEMGFVELPVNRRDRKTRLILRKMCGSRDIDNVVTRKNLRIHMMLGDTDMV
jgi:N-acetylglutamate synthase-like GNAT family acetyltransferase